MNSPNSIQQNHKHQNSVLYNPKVKKSQKSTSKQTTNSIIETMIQIKQLKARKRGIVENQEMMLIINKEMQEKDQ